MSTQQLSPCVRILLVATFCNCVSAFDFLEEAVFSIEDVDFTGTILLILGAVLLVIIIIIVCLIKRWRRNRQWKNWMDKTFHSNSDGEEDDDVKTTIVTRQGKDPMKLAVPQKAPIRAQTTPVRGDITGSHRYTVGSRVSVG